jgi:hypothetical protein
MARHAKSGKVVVLDGVDGGGRHRPVPGSVRVGDLGMSQVGASRGGRTGCGCGDGVAAPGRGGYVGILGFSGVGLDRACGHYIGSWDDILGHQGFTVIDFRSGVGIFGVG